jgi:hypothetical protein
MSKGSKRRPGEGYAENYDRIFGKKVVREEGRRLEVLELSQANIMKVVSGIPVGDAFDELYERRKAEFAGRSVPSFGRATIKMEGGIADPADCDWDFNDPEQMATYRTWKAKFDAEQDRLYGVSK